MSGVNVYCYLFLVALASCAPSGLSSVPAEYFYNSTDCSGKIEGIFVLSDKCEKVQNLGSSNDIVSSIFGFKAANYSVSGKISNISTGNKDFCSSSISAHQKINASRTIYLYGTEYCQGHTIYQEVDNFFQEYYIKGACVEVGSKYSMRIACDEGPSDQLSSGISTQHFRRSSVYTVIVFACILLYLLDTAVDAGWSGKLIQYPSDNCTNGRGVAPTLYFASAQCSKIDGVGSAILVKRSKFPDCRDRVDGFFASQVKIYESDDCTGDHLTQNVIVKPTKSDINGYRNECEAVEDTKRVVSYTTINLYENSFESDMDGFSCVDITSCGSFGNICGGYGKTGGNHVIKRTFTNNIAVGDEITVTLKFFQIDDWDYESAYVKINGVECWRKQQLSYANGNTYACGRYSRKDRMHTASCSNVRLTKAYVELEVGTTLDEDSFDEAFAIDDVVLTKRSVYSEKTVGTTNYMKFECSEDRECSGSFGEWSNDCNDGQSTRKRTYTIKTEGSGIYARCPYDDQYVEKEDCASSHGPKSVEFEVFSHAILVFIGIFIGVNSVL